MAKSFFFDLVANDNFVV